MCIFHSYSRCNGFVHVNDDMMIIKILYGLSLDIVPNRNLCMACFHKILPMFIL